MGLSNLLLSSLCLAAAIAIGGFWIGSGHSLLSSSTSGFQNASRDPQRHQRKCQLSFDFPTGEVSVGGEVWMSLGHACYRRNGTETCRESIAFREDEEVVGKDPLGDFREYSAKTNKDDDDVWDLTYRSYPHDPSTLFFSQHFRNDLEETSYPAPTVSESADDGMASWFPSFRFTPKANSAEKEERRLGDNRNKNLSSSPSASSPPLGYLAINGGMAGSEYRIAPLHKLDNSSGFESGPIAIFSTECVVVLSTASSFMSSSSLLRKDFTNDQEFRELGFGVMGSIERIPKDHKTSTILSSSPLGDRPDGIRHAFSKWGKTLLQWYGTRRPNHDGTLEYLQYSTDNGAFYYYHTEPNRTYQETILQVHEHAIQAGIPIRNWLMDSWFYHKGPHGGVTNWTARPQVFPDGIEYLRRVTGWEIVAHNRWWSSHTVYAQENGGEHSFRIEDTMALPLEETFWDDLFARAKLWGLTVYEQDWLNVQTQGMNYTLQTVEAARTWLVQMGKAAKRQGIHLQYCMSLPRHILQSLEVDAVTQARATGDYQPNHDYWIELGVTSMFVFALGVTPLKDNFWSSDRVQPTHRYDFDRETANRLQAIVATYSTGSVAPSDNFRFLNASLIMRSCSRDGRLLRPDLPAVRTDATILEQAGLVPPQSEKNYYDSSGKAHQVWSTMTELDGYVYTYILAADSPSFVLTENDLYPSPTPELHRPNEDSILWELDALFEPRGLPYQVPSSNRTNAHVYCIAPVFANGWSFLGEAKTKWTPVSQDRFSQLQVDSRGFSVTVLGSPGEVVHMVVRTPGGEFCPVDCTLSSLGEGRFDSSRRECIETRVQPSESLR